MALNIATGFMVSKNLDILNDEGIGYEKREQELMKLGFL
jgi:hypothetical protein